MHWAFWLLASPAWADPTPTPTEEVAPDAAARQLIAQAVDAHGLRDPENLEIRFAFRGTPYRLVLNGRSSRYERTVSLESGASRVDRLLGDAFTSEEAGEGLALSAKREAAMRRSLNSVAYFALLPRPLEDGAVIATASGRSTLGGESWDTLEVRFQQEGGGEDHDDVFRYWLHPETHRIGYLGYTFHTGGGGVRLRKVIGTHEAGGVVLHDYANLGRDGHDHTLDKAAQDFDAGTLPKVSEILLTDVAVGQADSNP